MCHIIFKLKTWIVFVAAVLTACGQGPTPLPTETPILPTATTAAPIGSQASLSTADLLARAEAAEKQMHSARLRYLQKMEATGWSISITCDGVAEPPDKEFLSCETAGTRLEIVILSEKDGFTRRIGTELWQKLPEDTQASPLENISFEMFGRDAQIMGEETIDGVASYLVQSSLDLGALFSSQPQMLKLLNFQQSSGSIKAWIGKSDFLTRRFELSTNLKGAEFEVKSTTTTDQSDFDKPVAIPNPEPYASLLTMTTSDPVFQVTFSPNGQTLAACDDDATIYLWPTFDPEIGGRFIDHPEGLAPSDGTFRMLSADFYSLAFSPDSQVLAAGTLGEVLLYALADMSAKPASLAVEKGTHVQAVAYSPDGKYLAAGGDNNIIYVWSMMDPKSAPVILKGHSGPIRDLVFLPSSATLASASEDKTIQLWDLRELKAEPQLLSGHKMPVYDLTLSTDGKTLLSVGFKDPVYAWSMETPSMRPTLLIPAEDSAIGKAPTLAIALSPDGKLLATSEVYGEVRLWAAPKFSQPYATFATGNQYDIMSLAFSPDGRYLAAGQGSNMVHIWDLKPGMPRQTKRPTATVSANGLTVEEILARNMQAMAALQSMQITMTIDTTEPRQSGNAMPTAWQAMTVTASLSLPKGAQGGLAASGVTHQRVVLADGQIVTQTYAMNPWNNQLPQTPVSPQHDNLALGQVGRFARMPEFMGTTSLDGHETYALMFSVSPQEFFKVEPMLSERFGGQRVQVMGRAWIGQHDFLTRRVIYTIVLKTPWVDIKTEYSIDLGAFNAPADIAKP